MVPTVTRDDARRDACIVVLVALLVLSLAPVAHARQGLPVRLPSVDLGAPAHAAGRLMSDAMERVGNGARSFRGGRSGLGRNVVRAVKAASILTGPAVFGLASPASAGQPSGPTTTLAINPGEVSTFAGSGADADQDGTGTSASFAQMSGAVVVSGYAYVGTMYGIRKINTSTGVVTTLAGGTTAGCVDSSDPTLVRFNNINDVASDESYIYSAHACYPSAARLRKTSIATGQTTTISTTANVARLTMGPDGYLYATQTSGDNIIKIDPSTGAFTTFATISSVSMGAIAADGTDLWVASNHSSGASSPSYRISKVSLSAATVTTFATSTAQLGFTALASAGDYIYGNWQDFRSIRRWKKSNAEMVHVAGTSGSGYVDGTGTDAWFARISGLWSDGSALWVNDSWNRRIRKMVAGTALPAAQQALLTSTLAISPGAVSTFAGDGQALVRDGVGTGASLHTPQGVVVHGSYAYVGTWGAIQKVSLATGETTLFAGHATETGCTDAVTGTSARFGAVGAMATDGYYLYLRDTCLNTPIRRVSLATGATSTVAWNTGANYLAVGPDNKLYASDSTSGGSIVTRWDPITGASSNVGSTPSGASTAFGITADANYLYVAANPSSGQRRIYRVDPATGVFTMLVTGASVGVRSLVSAGDYLYSTAYPDSSVTRYRKSDGVASAVAGTGTDGYADGVGTEALFHGVYGLASDGVSLWAVDRLNNRLRRIIAGPVGGGPTVTENPTGSNSCSPCVFNWVNENLSGVTYYPVNAQYGNFFHEFGDLALPGRGPAIGLGRTYNSDAAFSAVDSAFGYGWSFSYGISLSSTSTTATIKQENGAHVQFDLVSGAWVPHVPRSNASLVHNGDGTWTFVRKQSETITFDSSGRLSGVTDRNAYTTAVTYPTLSTMVVTDPAGRTLTLTLTGGHVTGAADSTGRSLTYTYDGSGNLTDVIDIGGGHWVFTYDSSHRMLTMRYPKFYGDTTTTPTPVVTNHYDSAGRVDWQSDPLGRTTSFDYTTVAGSTKITDPKGNQTLNTYVNGLLVSMTKGYGSSIASTWRFGYDPVTAAPTQAVDPNGKLSAMYVDSHGNVTATVDALGRTTTTTYNGFNQPLTTTDATGVTTTLAYDTAGNITSRARPLLGSDGVTVVATQTTSYNYGATTPVYAGDVTSIVDPVGETWTYRYDSYGNLVKTIAPPTPENSAGNTTTYAYNAARGWMTSAVSPKGNVTGGTPADYTTTFEHDSYGRVTVVKDPLWSSSAPTLHKSVKAYDANGNLSSSTDGNGNTTTYAYNPAGELVTVTRPDSTTLGNDYWADGRLHHQYDGANEATTYTYDAQGRLATMADPLGRTTTFGYDPAGNPLTRQEHGGNCAATPKTSCTTRTYDAANQLKTVTYSDGTTPNVTAIGYDSLGRRTSMTDGTGSSVWGYDSLGRLSMSSNGASSTLGFSYDLAGRQTTLAYPGGSQQVTRTFDDAGRLASITDWSSRTTTFSYDEDSRLTATVFPNGTTSSATFDRAGGVEALDLLPSGGGTPLASLDYTRDGTGQVDSQAGTGLGQASESYDYTALEQLESVNSTAVFDYDAADNLTRLRGATLVYDDANELTSSTPDGGSATSYAYDTRGNRTSRTPPGASAVTYGWDLANRMTSANSGAATYAYDGDGLRASKTVGGVTTAFTWDASGGLPLAVKVGTTSVVYGPGGLPLQQVASDGTTHWFFHDQLGSARALTSSAGAVVGTWAYDPYGSVVASSGTATTAFGFTGEYTDAETGFVYLRARYYDPATGQFLSRDPLVSQTGEPYGYVGGNPLNDSDPSGLCWGPGCWVEDAIDVVEEGVAVVQEIWRDPGAAVSDGAKGAANFGAGFTNAALGTDFCGWDGAGQSWSRNIGSATFWVESALAAGGGAMAASGKTAGDLAYRSRLLGADSYLFGNSTLGSTARSGLLNPPGRGAWRLGWSVNGQAPGGAVPGFRVKVPGDRYGWLFHATRFWR